MSPEWKIEIRQARTWLTSVRRKKNNLNGGGMPTAYTRRSPPVLTSSSNVNLSGNGSNETATRRIWRGIFLSLFPFLLVARAAPRSIRIPSIPNSKALRTQLIKNHPSNKTEINFTPTRCKRDNQHDIHLDIHIHLKNKISKFEIASSPPQRKWNTN